MTPDFSIDFLADHPQFIETAAAWLFADRAHFYPQESKKDALQKILGCQNKGKIPFALVVQRDQEAAGMVCLVNNDAPPAFMHLTPWLAGLVVAPKFHGQGLEEALLSRAISEARNLGCAELYLWTDDDKEWYRQLGWQIVGTTIFGRRYVVAMRLELMHGS